MADNQQRSMAEMQRDAEHRIKEMQQRANRAVSGNDMPPVPNFVRMNNRQDTHRQNNRNHRDGLNNQNRSNGGHNNITPASDNQSQKSAPPKSSGILNRFKGLDILKLFNFQNFKIDNDVLIIIVLIFLLSTEETDELLLLALVYIML